jgi:hypothetical protein
MNSITIYGHSDDKLGVIDDLASADRQFTLGYLFSPIFSSRRQYETISLPEAVKSAAYRKELIKLRRIVWDRLGISDPWRFGPLCLATCEPCGVEKIFSP